jgi:hypothetical protein
MRPPRAPKRTLSAEPLEDRCNPTTGVPWLNPTGLKLSFVPDGTDISGVPSTAAALLAATPTAAWQREALRAYQTWAAQANINIGLTTDDGSPMGTPGAPQSDPRFGDFRIGARPLSSGYADSLAGSVGFSYAGGTWSGDVVLNSKFNFGIGATATRNDLFTVLLQEAGNSLSLLDNPGDKTSVMYPAYQGRAVTGLGAADVTAIRTLYGPRQADKYEGAAGNDTLATAYDLTANGNVTALTADVTQAGDADVYKFTTPSLLSGVSRLSVDLKAAGLSLFTGRVTVYDAAQNVVGTAVATDPTANNLSVPVANYRAGATYYVRVEGAGADVFSVGAYNLQLTYDRAVGLSALSAAAPFVNYEGWLGHGTQALAQTLSPISAGSPSTFAVGGLLTSPTESDWFRFTPAASAGGTLTLSVWALAGGSLLPTVQVYDAAGTALPAEVVANDRGLYTIQVQNRGAGGTYYARVAAADPLGGRALGLYVLGTDLGAHPPTLYDSLARSTLTSAQSLAYSTMTVGEARLTQFALSATTGTGTAAAVRMSVYDANGKRVFTLVAAADQPLATGAVWLPSGTYTVVYNAATRSGAPLPALTFAVRKWERSSPIDPLPMDPVSPPPPPPPSGEVSFTPPTPTPTPPPPPPITGTGPVAMDPISNPYDNL